MVENEAAHDRESGPGFTVHLERASLFDLIQFECMDRERKILCVTAAGHRGMLYFRDGNLVHASTGDLSGESALGAMLLWQHGQIAHVAGGWPVSETIHASWQSVLLHAATAHDEVSRVDNVLSFPSREVAGGGAVGDGFQPDERSALSIHAIRITASGDVRAAAADRDTAETFAYVAELADRLGDALAIDGMLSIEIWSTESSAVLVRDPKSNELRAAWASRDVDPTKLRERLGQMPIGEI